MAAKEGGLSIETAWNSVALEERLELIARANAHGIIAGFGCFLLMGAVAYGFDKVWLLPSGLFGAILIAPLYTSHSWRRARPELILKYLAVRSVARRFAYGAHLPQIDIVLLFQGQLKELTKYSSDSPDPDQREIIGIANPDERDFKDVWICLLRGGIVMLSEASGGADLEFVTPITPDIVLSQPEMARGTAEGAVQVVGAGISKGRTVVISSQYPGALYVLGRKLQRLHEEAIEAERRLSDLRQRELAAS